MTSMITQAYRKKKPDMAYNRPVFDSPAANHIGYVPGAKKNVGYRESQRCISQDSGYNESLKAFSPGCCESSNDSSESNTFSNEYENSENLDPTLLCSPVRSEIFWEPGTGAVDKRQAEIYETPRVIKKDFSLRRRLLVAKATSGGTLDFETSECSMDTSRSKKAPQHLARFETRLSKSLDSPRETIYKPLATSTLKAEPDVGTSCKNWRISFAQQRSSTIDDFKCDHDPFPEVDNLSPVKHSSHSPNDSILSSNEENTPEMPATPVCNLMSHAKDDFLTPVGNLAASFHFTLCTPTAAQGSDLENSLNEDSAFHSLSFDKSQDSLTDHEGSFQELIQKQKLTPKSAPSKSRLRKLDRCKRLSTLRERGSQSEVEEDYSEKHILSSTYKSKVARDSVDEENELSFVDCQTNCLLKVEDLTGTPALRVVHDMLAKSTRKRAQQTTVQDLLGSFDSSPASEDVLARLIGRKMGLEKVDILYELKFRNLNHILTFIFKVLDVDSICSIWKVSKGWREMVIQDKDAHQRRKVFLKKLRADIEQERVISSEDAATRLQVVNRSALKSVQAQARLVFHTPTSSAGPLTPKETNSVPQSGRKQQEYIKIAKTLFTDEALKPCPQCQYPAKYQPLKKRGKCSRKDCGFDFCILCLCTFHGSKECSTGSGKRIHKKDILPGSAQSKRNLKRL
ncbi:PREDICTED: F-box only protein 43 [Nanorana parkeri]|uniref:F-box only protein 43 n=1 Tax=Nanorana parkeri TaxID=125878 RepID=UPI000854FCFE|nr:PREDICTED: F-box only protein 43 [Nanorana parkeri]